MGLIFLLSLVISCAFATLVINREDIGERARARDSKRKRFWCSDHFGLTFLLFVYLDALGFDAELAGSPPNPINFIYPIQTSQPYLWFGINLSQFSEISFSIFLLLSIRCLNENQSAWATYGANHHQILYQFDTSSS